MIVLPRLIDRVLGRQRGGGLQADFCAQALEHADRQVSVGGDALGLLPGAQADAGPGADHAVHGTGIEPKLGQGGLGVDAVGQGERNLIGPGRV